MGKKTEGWDEPITMTLDQKKELIGYFTLCQNGELDTVVIDKTHTMIQFLAEQAQARWQMLMHMYEQGGTMTRKELTALIEELYPSEDADFKKSKVERLLKGQPPKAEETDE
jgi:hypothetical protein